MAINRGFSGLNSLINSEDPSNSILANLDVLNSQFITGRVTDIILSNKHPLFNQYGGWSGLGTIFFEPISNLGTGEGNFKPIAIPLIRYLKTYPLVNELVFLLSLPSKNVNVYNNFENTNIYYYINPISIWNTPNQNAFPNNNAIVKANQNSINDYEEVTAGLPTPVAPETEELNFNSPLNGGTFDERSNIHPLLPYEGDVIHEGRWGNSIRLGSTVSGSNISNDYQNNWSLVGDNGDPLMILRNGQPTNASSTGWLPIVENIKDDLSSIYLTSYQKIPLKAASEDFSALSPLPLLPREYFNPQIILNSNRLIFNANENDIILSAQNNIALSSNKQIGLTSKNVNLMGESIKLGGVDANEPAILGKTFIEQFTILVQQIEVMATALSGLEGYDTEATNIESSGISEAGDDMVDTCKNLLKLLPKEGKITSVFLSNTIRFK